MKYENVWQKVNNNEKKLFSCDFSFFKQCNIYFILSTKT